MTTMHPLPDRLSRTSMAMAFTIALSSWLGCSRTEGPQASKPPPPPPAAAAAAAATPGDDELKALLQRTLDHPRLAPFWHPELPERRPLRVVKNAVGPLMAGLKLHGQPVEVLPRAELEDRKLPFLEVRELRPGPDRVSLRFTYAVEGVVGEVIFKRQGGEWAEDKVEIAER